MGYFGQVLGFGDILIIF